MKNKIVKLLCLGLLMLGSIASVLTLPAYAKDPFCDDLKAGSAAYEAAGCSEDAKLEDVVRNILIAVIGIAGFVAVVFIVIGGVNYMTSSGDANKVKKAKDTILYAVIGLIICALAFAIVNWAIDAINNSTSYTSSPSNIIAFLTK